MSSLSWVCCPKCGGSDVTRIGKPLVIGVKRLKGSASGWAGNVLTTTTNTAVHCNFCGTTFSTEQPTRREAFGYDGEENTPY